MKIAGKIVDEDVFHRYIKHIKRGPVGRYALSYEVERCRLHNEVYYSAGFKNKILKHPEWNEEHDRPRIRFRQTKFGLELDNMVADLVDAGVGK